MTQQKKRTVRRKRRTAADLKAAMTAKHSSMPGAEPYEVVTCEETGAQIKRFKPGYCRGSYPQKNVKGAE